MKQGKAQLDILKDYDKRLAEETAARAYQAQETARLQVRLFPQITCVVLNLQYWTDIT